MSLVKTVQITDRYVDGTGQTFSHRVAYNKRDITDTHMASTRSVVEAMLLFTGTARTNVTLRDSKGRFVSYKNPKVHKDLSAGVKLLIPFPMD